MSIDRMSRTPSPATEKLSAEEQAIAEFLADAGQTDATTLAPVLAKLRSSDSAAGSARLSTLLVGDSSSRERRRPGLNRLIALTLAVGGAMGLGVGAAAAVNPDFRESAKLTVAALVGSLTAGSSPLTGDTATDDTGDDTSGDGPDDLADGGLLEPRSELLAEESANEAGAPSPQNAKEGATGSSSIASPVAPAVQVPNRNVTVPNDNASVPDGVQLGSENARSGESGSDTDSPGNSGNSGNSGSSGSSGNSGSSGRSGNSGSSGSSGRSENARNSHNDFGGETSGDADADEKKTSHGEDTPPVARNH